MWGLMGNIKSGEYWAFLGFSLSFSTVQKPTFLFNNPHKLPPFQTPLPLPTLTSTSKLSQTIFLPIIYVLLT
jgi:hypothetical protein